MASYLYTQPDATPGGLDWELAQAITKEAGCKLQVQAELPTARRQRLFEQGQLNLMLSASNTPSAAAMRASAAYRHETVGVFSRTAMRGQFQNITSVEAVLDHKLSLLAPKVGWYGAAYAAAADPVRLRQASAPSSPSSRDCACSKRPGRSDPGRQRAAP
jgi:polar amino acid transport system substrate-binding protein